LAAIAVETAGHAAWLHHDLGDRSGSEQWYTVSIVAASDAGQPALDGYVRGFRSLIRAGDGRSDEALEMARAAGQLARHSGTPMLRSWLSGLEAQALAAQGDAGPCAAALRRAEHALEQARPGEDPPWFDSFDRLRHLALAGDCYLRLGKRRTAEQLLDEALAALEPTRSRRRSEVLLSLAEVHRQRSDIDAACGHAVDSLNAALEASSVAGVERVIRFREQLGPWGQTRAMRDLDQRLLAVL
jgi:tetratricopeptide (TPR) repeat protein